jgi:hypothetical protein
MKPNELTQHRKIALKDKCVCGEKMFCLSGYWFCPEILKKRFGLISKEEVRKELHKRIDGEYGSNDVYLRDVFEIIDEVLE